MTRPWRPWGIRTHPFIRWLWFVFMGVLGLATGVLLDALFRRWP
jgi:hypothetical protein